MTDRTKDAAELSLPAAATIRERLARNQREAAMLRRLLRIASDAEKLNEAIEQPMKREASRD